MVDDEHSYAYVLPTVEFARCASTSTYRMEIRYLVGICVVSDIFVKICRPRAVSMPMLIPMILSST